MPTGRTISASFLTDLDKKVIELCMSISSLIENLITGNELKKDFKEQYGKISRTRDAGAGRGGGKLQRDAICTRGKSGNAPYSNRNLRWHPLVVASKPINFAKPIERIEIEGDKTLIFVVKENNTEREVYAEQVHTLKERYVALPEHWIEHIDTLKVWRDEWLQNRCVIPAYEACDWQDSVETYATLAISLAVEYYKVNFDELYPEIITLLQNQEVDKSMNLPTSLFPKNQEDFLNCPVCKLPLSNNLKKFRIEKRQETWTPDWQKSKKTEGNDGSNQILHINPLIETEIRHKANTVKYGHRWCNVAMTDHSLKETVNFMEFIVKAHNKW